MAMIKVTFSLAPETVGMLNNAAERLAKPKSQVVRDAIHDYHARVDRLSEAERIRMLAALDQLVSTEPSRSAADVERELEEIRASRRSGGRLARAE
jgi:predicted DNA-binding protein